MKILKILFLVLFHMKIKSLEILLISIISKLKNEEIIIIIVQYNKELLENENFIIQLK